MHLVLVNVDGCSIKKSQVVELDKNKKHIILKKKTS